MNCCPGIGRQPLARRLLGATPELDYACCSPYRVPIARLAAAQAALSKERADTTA